MKSILNKKFDKIYCINLDKRKDRWKKSLEIFKYYNIEVERFPAIDGHNPSGILPGMKIKGTILEDRPGLLGCSLSHFSIISKAKESNLDNIFIFEDDFILIDDFNNKLEKAIDKLPKNWDMFYLGANHLKPSNFPIKFSEYIYKLKGSYSAHAYGVNKKFFDIIINTFENLEKGNDQHYYDLHKKYNCYVTWPHLAWQRSGYSDIMMGNRDYKRLKNSYYNK